MKRAIIFLATIGVLLSCKKDKIEQTNTPITISPDQQLNGMTTQQPGLQKNVGGAIVVTGTQEERIEVSFAVQGTIPVAKLHNFRFIFLDKDSVEIFRSPYLYTVTTSMQYPTPISVNRNSPHRMKLFMDVDQGVIGEITMQIKVRGILGNAYTGPQISVTSQKIMFTPFPRYPSITYVYVPGSIDTAQQKPVYEYTVTASPGDTLMLNQLTYGVHFQHPSADTGATMLALYRDGTDITSRGKFSDGNGNEITVLRKNVGKIVFTFTEGGAEDTLIADNHYQLYLKFTTLDPYGISGLSDASWSTGFSFINAGSGGIDSKLYSSKVQNSSAKRYNFIWSYFTRPHSALKGFSTNDWRNGYGIFSDLEERVWTP